MGDESACSTPCGVGRVIWSLSGLLPFVQLCWPGLSSRFLFLPTLPYLKYLRSVPHHTRVFVVGCLCSSSLGRHLLFSPLFRVLTFSHPSPFVFALGPFLPFPSSPPKQPGIFEFRSTECTYRSRFVQFWCCREGILVLGGGPRTPRKVCALFSLLSPLDPLSAMPHHASPC